jgi:hypothetical protein
LKERLIVYAKDLRSGFTLPFIPSPQGRGNSREPPLKGGGKKEWLPSSAHRLTRRDEKEYEKLPQESQQNQKIRALKI